ncbi:MAG: carboxylesterase family protein [Ginsengibacter sp.]
MQFKKANLVTTFTFAIGVALIFLSFRIDYKAPFQTVKVEGGLISGTTNSESDVHIFKGIPFAAPPVGNLRWKEPQPVIPWNGVKRCVAFGSSPVQNSPSPFGPWSEEYLIPKEPISEDCLYLNVWTGTKSSKEKRPVLIWIYGGGFVSGGTAVPVYDGEAMAKKGIIFVSVNYRVGVFGFFALPELTKESANNVSGNYALLDQIAAIKWVKKNIAAFGGDPDNITIAGQSAGSMSVNCLVTSPLCKGLFKHAIGESGAEVVESPGRNMPTLQQAEEKGTKYEQSLNVSSLEALKKIPAEELLKTQWSLSSPIIDGYLLPKSIPDIFAAGEENNVDLLTGWNEDDGLVFGKLDNAEEFKKHAEQKYGADAEKFLYFYPANNDEEADVSQHKLSRDMMFGIQNYTWANLQSKTGKSKVYLYRFARKLPATGDYIKYGAFHTGEVAYAYDNLSFVHRCPWQPADYALKKTMSSFWINFIKTGNPNAKNLPEWSEYNRENNSTMIFNETSKVEQLPGKNCLDFLIKEIKKNN